MSAFRGIFLSGSSRAALSIDRTQLPAGQTGALAQLGSGLTPPLTFSRISGTGLTVDAAGVVSVGTAFTAGESRDLVVRVQNPSGDAAERRFALTGFATALAPTITNAGTISGGRGAGNTLSGTAAAANGLPAPIISYQWEVNDGTWSEIGGATGQGFTETALTQGLPIRRRVTATNTEGEAIGFSNQLAALAPTLGVLGLGAATLTDAMAPGAVVATISGKTAGSSVSMTGPAFTNGWLAVNGSGTAVVVGVAGPLTAGQATGVFSLVETLAGATNTPRVSGPFSSITAVAASAGLRLVRLSTDYFPDTAAVGDTLATVQFAPPGSTITVETEDGIANAFTVSGTSIRPGTGYAAIPCRMIVLHIRVTHLGVTKLTRKVVRKFSAGAPDFPVCTTEQNLTDALAAAATWLNGGANRRYVIELNKTGGAEWDALRQFDLNITQAGSQLIVRAPGHPATAPHHKMNRLRLNVRGGEGLYMQNVDAIVRMTGDEWANNVSGSLGAQTSYGGSACIVYQGNSTNVGPYRFLNCNRKGGVVSHAGYNPDLSYDPRNDATSKGMWRVGELFYFWCQYSGSAAPIVQIAPYDPVARANLPAITRAANPSGGLFSFPPQYVGDNLPGGVLPSMVGWPATGGVPLEFRQQTGFAGTPAQMRMGVVFLAEGHPDAYAGAGNYANALQIDSWGTGYAVPTGLGAHGTAVCYWLTRPDHPTNAAWTRRNLRSLSTGEAISGSGVSPDIEWDQCRFEDLSNVLGLPLTRAGTNRFLHKPIVDRFTLDVMSWGTNSGSSVVQQDWGPTSPKIRIWFPIFGRCLSTSSDSTDPHSDILQLFSNISAPDLRFYLDVVAWTYDAGRFTRGSAQNYFFTDANGAPINDLGDAYDGCIFHHCQRGGIKSLQINFTSRWRQHRFIATSGSYQLALGQDGVPGMRRNELGSYAYVSEMIAPGTTFPKSQQVLVENFIPYNPADFPAMNTYDFLDTPEKVIESFTPAAGSAAQGHVPVEFLEQEVDWVHGGHDPDTIPVKFPFVPNFDVAEGAFAITAPRQIHYGVDPVAAAPGAGTSYQTGSNPDFNGDFDSPSAWFTTSSSIPRGTSLKLRKTTPTGVMQQGIAEIVLNGATSQARSYTRDRATPLIVSDATTGSWLMSDNSVEQSPLANFGNMRRWVIFGKLRVPFPYIPSSNLTLFRGSTTNPLHVFLTSSGNLRAVCGLSTEINIAFDRQRPLKAGGDYSFVCAVDYNVFPYFDDPATATAITSVRPGLVQAFADFLPMSQNSGGTGFIGGPNDQDVPFRLGQDPRIFANEADAQRPVGWGLYHFGIWCDTGTANLPDFLDWNVLRRFTSEFLDGDSAPYPGKGVIEALGPGLRLLVRGTLAEANGAGLPNLAPNSAPNTNAGPIFGNGSMAPFVLGAGSPAFTGIIIPTEANFPVLNNGFSSSSPEAAFSGADLDQWNACAPTPLLPGERLVVAVASDGASNVLSAHPDSLGTWTMAGRAAASDSILHIFTCLNSGTEDITARLRVDGTTSGERMATLTYKATPRFPGASIGFACAVGNVASDPPSLDIGAVQRAQWLVFRSRSTSMLTTTDLPLNYGSSAATSTGSGPDGTRIQGGQRQLEAQIENPGQWQGTTATDGGGNATVALWEVLP